MFEGFTRTEVRTSGARIVTVHGGHGPPLLLMHGNPFSHVSWHKVAPRLAEEFTVVATDLRGYGDSEKPPGGKDQGANWVLGHFDKRERVLVDEALALAGRAIEAVIDKGVQAAMNEFNKREAAPAVNESKK